MYGWGCSESLSSKKLIFPLVCTPTLRQISVKAGITRLEHTLFHLRAEIDKLDWTDLPESAVGVHREAAVGPLPGAVRDDADGAW